ncbi:MAG: class I SAM-dependent methyltransferase [Neisseria elongata]
MHAELQSPELCRVRAITAFTVLPADAASWESILSEAKSQCDRLAASLARGGYQVQSIRIVSNPFGEYLESRGAGVVVESDEEFHRYAKLHATTVDGLRVRLIQGDARALAEAVGGSVDVAVYAEPVTGCGEVELLPFLREQAVSATNHRFGNPTRLLDGVL